MLYDGGYSIYNRCKGCAIMVKIYTLGDFDIRIDDKSILQSIGNQQRLKKLFKYFLTFNGKKLLPENIIEDICEEENFKEPLNMLRTQISRLRNIIDFEKHNIEPFFTITYIDGYYVFQLEKNCWVDFIEMENCIDSHNKGLDKDEIIEICKRGVNLYKGEFLGELGYKDWLIPVRNRLDRLYVNSLIQYLQVLKEKSMNNHIISICEEAIIFKPYEERIHIFFIESLVNLGQNQYALNHYKYFTTKMYNDLGEVPSNRLKDLYKKIKSREEKNYSFISLGVLDEVLAESNHLEGALICDNSYFKFLYNFKKRLKQRQIEDDVFLGIITVEKTGYIEKMDDNIKSAMLILLDIIYIRLRNCDVITKWNDKQLLLMLSSLKEEDIESIIDRFKIYFDSKKPNDNIALNIKFKKI